MAVQRQAEGRGTFEATALGRIAIRGWQDRRDVYPAAMAILAIAFPRTARAPRPTDAELTYALDQIRIAERQSIDSIRKIRFDPPHAGCRYVRCDHTRVSSRARPFSA